MNLAIVVSDFHKEITSEMLEAAKAEAEKNNLIVKEIVSVIGAFDIPLPLKRVLAKKEVDCAIVLGAVVQGETSHDEIVAYATAEKIQELSLLYNKPVGYGISGPRMTVAQAKKRAKEFAVRAIEAAVRSL
ncbi:MAG: 6,7-dimethyl-8-ribityllumazine synthase [Candidatus Diapherotrites archaeon CG11_big_fil_rev_8_21_14_0_20_37_9]|nr:MAG: 6,7-dimethyl-8-ribityllumazine synthase [Candidatus Diapherotrites archaeon CG11_big_fil_rev_8_21_14_0_20_37_9]